MTFARRLGLLAALAMAPAAGAVERPNILLIVAEDLSPRIGAYGDPVAATPAVDELAREGTRFSRAFTTSGVCAPSRAAIILGVHQNTWGAGHMRASRGGYTAVPPAHWKAFPELLRAAGYHTVNSGKTDYQMSRRFPGGVFGGPDSIWDESDGEDWRGREPGQPFFAYLTLLSTHESQVWPTWRVRSWIQLVLAPGRIRNHLAWRHTTDPASLMLPPYYPDTPTVRADLARHYNNIARMDRQLEAILARLVADGLADDTLVIFMSDHGDGLPRAKRWLYDSGLRVPFIVRWPGRVAAGAVNEELVSGVDLAPTLLSLAGVPVPEHMQGRIFLGPDAQPEQPYVYAARDRMDEQPDAVRAARDRRFKYIRNLQAERPYVLDIAFRDQMPMMQEMRSLAAEGRLEGAPALWFRPRRDPEELYDTAADPHEVRNLAADPQHAAVLTRMRAELDRWLAASGDLGLLPEDELRRRFWPEGREPVTAAPAFERAADARLALRCETPGASIEVRRDGGPWRLYTGPTPAPPGARLTARAVRYGWKRSDEVSLQVR
jgi:arylsulfatase A-like enzyme